MTSLKLLIVVASAAAALAVGLGGHAEGRTPLANVDGPTALGF